MAVFESTVSDSPTAVFAQSFSERAASHFYRADRGTSCTRQALFRRAVCQKTCRHVYGAFERRFLAQKSNAIIDETIGASKSVKDVIATRDFLDLWDASERKTTIGKTILGRML